MSSASAAEVPKPPDLGALVENLCAAFYGIDGNVWRRVSERSAEFDEMASWAYGVSPGTVTSTSPRILQRTGEYAVVDGTRYEVVLLDAPPLKSPASAPAGSATCRGIITDGGTLVADMETVFKVLFIVEARPVVDSFASGGIPDKLDEASNLLEDMRKWHLAGHGVDITQTALAEGLARYVTKSKGGALSAALNDYTVNNMLGLFAEVEMRRVSRQLHETSAALKRYPVSGDYTEVSALYENSLDLVDARMGAITVLARQTFPAYDQNVALYSAGKVLDRFKSSLLGVAGDKLKHIDIAASRRSSDMRLAWLTAENLANKAAAARAGGMAIKLYTAKNLVSTLRDALGVAGPLGEYYKSVSLRSEYVPLYRIYAEARYQQLLLAGAPATDTKPGGALSIVLAVDKSGSMRGAKLAEAKRAAETLVGLLADSDEAALVAFDSSVSLRSELSPVGDATGRRAALVADIRRLSDGGGTNFCAPLRVACEMFRTARFGKAVLLLSDGQAGYPVAEVRLLKSLGARVFTVTIGADADTTTLKRIADDTGGQFFPAGTTNLQQVFVQIGGRAKGYSDLLVEKGLIRPGEEKWSDVVLTAAADFLAVTLGWQGSNIDLFLERPDGTRIAQSDAAKFPGVSFSYNSQAHCRTVTVRNASPGLWRIGVLGSDVPAAGELYTLTATESNPTAAHVLPFEPEYGTGRTVLLGVQLPQGAVSTPHVQALVSSPLGGQFQVDLADDGSNGDTAAGDGLFSGWFRSTADPGFYQVVYHVPVRGHADRPVVSTFQVGSVQDVMASTQDRWFTGGGGSGGAHGSTPGAATGPGVLYLTMAAVFLLFCCAAAAILLVILRSRNSQHAPQPSGTTAAALRITVGRSPDNDIVLSDGSISARHCEVTLDDGVFVIRDLGSSNGVVVNGRPVGSTVLSPGDTVMLGDVRLPADKLINLLESGAHGSPGS